MHRIRSRIDRLEEIDYSFKETGNANIALEINRMLTRKLKDVREELEDEIKEGFYQDPNRVLYAVIAEFYDRVNFSYSDESVRNAEDAWKSIYRDNCEKVWADEFADAEETRKWLSQWSELAEKLNSYSKTEFTLKR